MKSLLKLLLLCCSILAFAACHNEKDLVEIDHTDFAEEVAQLQNLTITFNKDLQPDSLLNKWDSSAYIEFSPSVKGGFRWSSPSQLVFSPSKPFEPGTEYTATVTKAVLHKSASSYYLGDKKEVRFHTAPLQIADAHVYWTRGESNGSVVAQLDMELNYEVQVSEAAAHVKLESKGNSINFHAVSTGRGKTISLQFPLEEATKDEETPLNITLGSGIAVPGSKYVSAKDTTVATLVPSRYVLEVTSVIPTHTGTEGIVTINTSQPLLENNLKDLITFEPAITSFELSVTDAGITVGSPKFKADQAYELTISKKLEGSFGGKMKADFSQNVVFGKIDPMISFVNQKGIYLSSQGYKNLLLNIVNVPNVSVTVIKVYENNMEFFLRDGQSYGYDWSEDDDGGGGSYHYYSTDNLGDTVFHKDYATSTLKASNTVKTLHLDFSDHIRDYDGVYVISVKSKDHAWIQDSKILCLSDIGLIVKEEKEATYVFANSIRTAQPIAGTKISFIGRNNQRVYTAETDAEGMVKYEHGGNKPAGFNTALITARKDNEFSFVWLQQSAVETSRFDVGGRMPNDAGLNAYIYAERNLYRPGETIHLSTIVRNEQWNNPGGMPVKMRLDMPNGKEFSTIRKILNEEGSSETYYDLPQTAMTGTWVLRLYTGNDVLIGSYDISVEDFVPDRVKVSTTTDKTEYLPGDAVKVSIQADNLFGTPAANRDYECELNINNEAFRAKSLPDYDFTIRNAEIYQNELKQGSTNENGSASEQFVLPDKLKNSGLLKGNVMTTVFDENGRPVHRYAHFSLYTQNSFLGIKGFDQYVTTRRPMRIGLIAVDKSGKPQTGVQATITILKKEWHTAIEQNGSHYRYVSQYETRQIAQSQQTISGSNTSFPFTPQLSGEYEIRIALPGSSSYVSQSFYAYGWGDTQYSSFEVNNEGNVDIKPDKDKYAVGETAKLLFTTPFDGRMLVSIERGTMIEHQFVDVHNKSASISLKTDDQWLPNVYVSATLFRPMNGSGGTPLTVAHGYRNMMVENRQNHLPVAVTVAASSRSRTRQTITVKTTPGAMVTIAAVDEGILQVKNYQTPEPYNYFYQKTALSVNSYDIYPLLLPEVKTTLSSTGGDGSASDANLRVNPMFVNRIKNVSFWSGIKKADGSGVVRYTIDVPQFSGDLRVMAVAYKGKGFGGADQHMKVADPVIISTGLPRFFSPKDEAIMPVTLSNTTAKEAKATVTTTVAGPLSVLESAMQTITIPANKEARATFRIAAKPAIGVGKVTVTVKALNETFVNETDISIRPPASLQKRTGSGLLAEGQTVNLQTKADFIPSTASGKVIVSKSPLVQFTRNMEDLIHYPYGCVEQTTSAAFPQLYYADLVKSITGRESSNPNPAYNVQQAIDKLQSMQLYNGALSYWPGGGGESWWGSVYATHFLLEAQKAGFEVNSNTTRRLLQYLAMRLQKKETEEYWYNDGQHRKIFAHESIYSLYVLAMAGKADVSSMNFYKSNQDMLAPDCRYMLAAAYALSGQKAQALSVLPKSFGDQRAANASGGSFYSYIRDLGISLNVLMDVDPQNPQIGPMARLLSEQVRNARYLSTQENVWAILAMGKIARAANRTTATATITANGKSIGAQEGTNTVAYLKNEVSTPLVLKASGKGSLYYFWEIKGITTDGSYKEEDSYMKLRRTYFDRNGREITDRQFRQNDLVVIQLSLTPQYNGRIENVAVTDMLPAGFEIENTRLIAMPEMQWLRKPSDPDYMDIRDDRINFFTSLDDTTRNFYYMVRAVSPGSYQQGPAQADAMYNGALHSYNGAGVVKIAE